MNGLRQECNKTLSESCLIFCEFIALQQAAHVRLVAATAPRDTSPKAEYIAATALTCLAAGLSVSPPCSQTAAAMQPHINYSGGTLPGPPLSGQTPAKAGGAEDAQLLGQLPQQLLHLAAHGAIIFQPLPRPKLARMAGPTVARSLCKKGSAQCG